MARSTELADLFGAPALVAQRHYEICKAYFLDQTPAEQLARCLKGFAQASPQKLYRKFIDTAGSVEVERDQVRVRLTKRVHNPLLKEAGLTGLTPPVPWLGNRPVLLDVP